MKRQMIMLTLTGFIVANSLVSSIGFVSADNSKKELLKQASQMEMIQVDEMKKEGLNFVKNGKITDIVKKDELYSITVKTKEEEIVFHVAQSVFIFDESKNIQITVENLKKDDEVGVILSKDVPMTASLPAQISQIEGIILKEDSEDLMITMIDKNLKASNDEFVITKNDKMNVFHIKDPKKIISQEVLRDSESIILYKAATFSLPPQVKVDAAIVLNTMEELDQEGKMEEEKTDIVANPKYIPLRKHAEEKEYRVTWQGMDKAILLEKNDIVMEINLNSKKFKYSHMTRDLQPLDMVNELDLMPMLQDSVTMVSENLIKMLK